VKTRSGRKASQNPEELAAFVALLKEHGVRRYLEIGARHGDTFHYVMMSLPPDSVGVAVDLPGGAWGQDNTAETLGAAVDCVNASGRHAAMILGDSGERRVMFDVFDLGPYDAVLIDGDHRYDGVKRDWEIYGEEPRIIAFHDIAGEGEIQKSSRLPVEVPRLWAELKASTPMNWKKFEFIAPGSKMGIGVFVRPSK